MAYRCPKCAYERKLKDDAPDWQCPACGVAYAKVANSHTLQDTTVRKHTGGRSPKGTLGLPTVIALILLVAGGFFLFSSEEPEPERVDVAVFMEKFVEHSSGQYPSSKVTLYATKNCGYCRLTRTFFRRHNIRYREIDIETSREGYRQYRALGSRGVPVVVVQDEVMHGYSKNKLRRLLARYDLL